jgi:hypothetical protein
MKVKSSASANGIRTIRAKYSVAIAATVATTASK